MADCHDKYKQDGDVADYCGKQDTIRNISYQKSGNMRNVARQHVLTKMVQAPMTMRRPTWRTWRCVERL